MSTPTAEYATEKGPETRQLLAPPPPGPLGYYGAYQPPVVIPQDRPRNARRRRLWHFLACTFLFVGAMHLFAKRGPRGSKWYCGRPAQQQVQDDMYPYAPSDCSESVNWTTDGAGLPDEYPYHARTSFTLPVGAKELAFIAQGAQQHGHFELSQTADAGSDEAVVEVHVSYKAQNALSDATVCRLHPAEDSWGLGIFTSRHPHHHRSLWFHVHVRLPAADADSPLKIENLGTYLPQYTHHVGDIGDTAYFDFLRLKGSNSAVEAESVAGNLVLVKSSNGAIRGTYNTSTSLVLETSNAPISVSANLLNGNERPTVLYAKTSNGRVDAEVTLATNTSDGTQGKYHVTTRSSNAPVRLAFVDAPVDSALTAIAHTSNSPVHVTLHETYEGRFDASTSSWFSPEVRWKPVDDPAGRERKRNVRIDTVKRGQSHGAVYWDADGEERGSVVVDTSNSPVRLDLSRVDD
ncbi:hypothetical protein OH76DRAFT_1483681 [Lentinus brumalis]|uniref:DUF7330 domain-containing protein n=1 Tax=Lentinus brumalis TaxID=2498619 RepID=A0A371D7R8_9APHY|nr:hypothetical protein OH76DRAFT_1483681 [Polyporus brumalis]